MKRVLLTARRLPRPLHIGRTRVYDLIAAGEIVSVKIGHLRRIPVDAVRDYAARLVAEVTVDVAPVREPTVKARLSSALMGGSSGPLTCP